MSEAYQERVMKLVEIGPAVDGGAMLAHFGCPNGEMLALHVSLEWAKASHLFGFYKMAIQPVEEPQAEPEAPESEELPQCPKCHGATKRSAGGTQIMCAEPGKCFWYLGVDA